MTITPSLFEAYLKCPTKCFLRWLGQTSAGNECADFDRAQQASYETEGIKRLTQTLATNPCVAGDSVTLTGKRAKWRVAIGPVARAGDLESTIEAIEQVPAESQGKQGQLIPIRFIRTNTLTRDDRMLVAFDAFVLSEMLGCASKFAKIIHGDENATLKVKAGGLVSEVRKRIEKIRALVSAESPPDLILNRHCTVCEFQSRCRQKAIETDDLSLLANMSKQERKQYNSKGILTVRQLSFAFRPRRRPKHLREKREKYHHSLKALAIREHRIHIVGRPELKIMGTPIFFDVESVPDRDFHYLIGMRIVKSDCCVQHSFWADTQQEERKIWREFLEVCAGLKDPVLIHYGGYEAAFLKQMRERYPTVIENPALLEKLTKESVNVLAFVYGQIYFPTYSNSLKDIAGFLGFSWPERDATGVRSIIWRHEWEESKKYETQQKLRDYNLADCEALEFLVKVLWGFSCPEESARKPQDGGPVFVTASLSSGFSHPDWRKFEGAMPELDRINEAAQWDYQRDRIYLRTKDSRKRPRKRQIGRSPIERIDKVVSSPECPVCPKCLRASRKKTRKVSYQLQELVFGRSSIKRRTVKQDFQEFWCKTCKDTFGLDERFNAHTKFGWNFVSFYFYLVFDLGIQERRVARMFERLFDVSISTGSGSCLKTRIARYYDQTVQKILARITAGHLVQADETKARKRGSAGYVWVFTNSDEVVYLYSESREADTVSRVLKGFRGVLISDFYAAYDSIECPQQKCLIHLLRDMNNDVLAHPYDEELKLIVHNFASLLNPMIETIDRHGLKRRFLNKHLKSVDRFYKDLSLRENCSECALQLKRRFEKNRDKLFTFLRHNSVPWNNNNAEHAIKAYARSRVMFLGAPSAKTMSEYLVLLSICETCRNRGIDFLDFLRSGERDVEAFTKSKRPKAANTYQADS